MNVFRSTEVHCALSDGSRTKREIGYFIDPKTGDTKIDTRQNALRDVTYFRAPGAFAPDYFRTETGWELV